MGRPEVVGEKILHEKGNYRRVKRWYRGWWPKFGTQVIGWTGRETVREEDLIRPIRSFIIER